MPYNFSTFKIEIKKVGDFLNKEYTQLNIGQASPMVLDGVSILSYGSHSPLKNVANIAIEGPKTLRVVPWDKTQIKDIEKAINAANLGLSVATDDAGIRVIFPQLTTDSRKNLVKVLKEKLEEQKVTVRRERERIWDDVQAKEKEGKLTEDERFRAKEELQKIIDEANRGLEASFAKKEKEVMG